MHEAYTHFEIAESYSHLDDSSQLVVDAISMRLAAAIETLARLEPQIRTDLFGEQWPLMWGMRNRIAHGYLLVNDGVIRATLRDDIPSVIATIRAALASTEAE